MTTLLKRKNTFLKKDCLCPVCFETFRESEKAYRCSAEEGACETEPDVLLRNHFGLSQTPQMGRIIDPKKGFQDKVKNILGGEKRCSCDKCGSEAIPICPHCHSELPIGIGEAELKTIVLLGPSGVGKSHYLTSLIHKFTQSGADNLDSIISTADESTRRLAGDHYLGRVFSDRKVLRPTKSYMHNPSLRQPLMYLLEPQRKTEEKSLLLNFYDTSGEDYSKSGLLPYQKILKNASGIVFFLDPNAIPGIPIAENNFDKEQIGVHTLEEDLDILVTTLHTLQIEVPVAFVIPKVDRFSNSFPQQLALKEQNYASGYDLARAENFSSDVKGYLGAWAGVNILNKIDSCFKVHQYFVCSSLGSKPQADHLNVISPYRVEEPLYWLLKTT